MIRPATKADIPELLALLQQLFSIEIDFNFDAERQHLGLNLLLESDMAIICVAEEEGTIIGMATGQLVVSTAEGGPSLLVEDLVVSPPMQKKGHGSQLLSALAQWGSERGAGRMQLLADQTNYPALEFYLHNKWRRTQLICLRKYYSS